MPGGFKYPSSSDIDPNVVDLLYRAIKPKLDSLIDERQQRRQVWGPTFKQEGIREIPIPDADYIVPAPEYGKRTLMFAGELTAQRTIQLPSLSGAWWIVRNNTPKNLKFIAGVAGTVGPIIASGDTGAVFTDGVTVWLFPTLTQDVVSDDWKWSTATSGAPASGYIQANNADPTLVTELSISETSQSGDAVPALDQLVPGAVIYVQDKDDGTKWARYEVSGAVVDAGTYRTIPVTYLDSAGVIANDEVVTVQISTGSSGGGGGGGGGGALPDGIGTEVQARAGPTTFKRVSYSITSDQHVSFAGAVSITLPPPDTSSRIVMQCTASKPSIYLGQYLTDDHGPIFLRFEKAYGIAGAPVDIAPGDWVGRVDFRARSGGAFKTAGYLDTKWNGGGIVSLGSGEPGFGEEARVEISENEAGTLGAVTLVTGSKYFQVQTFGHVISGGATGSIWYQSEPGPGPDFIRYYTPLDINPALDNGKVLTVVETGPSTGVYLPKWMSPAGGAGGGAPGIPDWSLQYRQNATTFGGVTSSIVTGANIVLGGELAFHNVASTDQHVRISAIGTDPAILLAKFGIAGEPLIFIRKGRGTHGLPEAIGDGDFIGEILFQGYDGTDWPTSGYLRAQLDLPVGHIVQLGAGPYDQAYIRVTHNAITSSAGLIAGAGEWRVQSDGLVTSYGLTGSMMYKAPGGPPVSPSVGYLWDLPIGLEGQVLTVTESTHPTFGDYLHPYWAAPSTGALPEGDFHELQSRWDANTFKRVLNSEVSGANIKLAGELAFEDTVSHRIDFQRNTVPGTGEYVGSVWFQVAGHLPDENVAVLRCINSGAGYVADFGLTQFNRVYVGEAATGLDFDGQFFQLQPGGLRLSGGAQGSLRFHNSHGGSDLFYDPLSIGAANTYLRSDGTNPHWAVLPAGTVTSPGGTPTQIQFHKTDGTFGGITGSAVDTNNVWLTGFVNVNNQVILNEAPAYITFRGDAGATIYGFIRGFGSAGNGVMEIACGESGIGPRVEVQQIGTAGLIAGANYFRVQTDGTVLAIGSRGALYFKGDSHYLVPLGILGTVPAPVYLKATGDLPFWSGIAAGDLTGVLPISKGGTGTGTAPGQGYLLIGKADGSYVPAILSEDTGILITEGDGTITIKCTITPGSGTTPPGGASPQLQFNNGGVFGGVPGSYVADDNITLTGNLTFIHEDNLPIYINFHRWGANLTHLDGEVALLNFYGLRSGSQVLTGFLRSYWDDYFGAAPSPIIEIGHSGTVAVRCSQGGAGLIANAHYVIATSSGVRISVGAAQGSMFYQSIVSGAYYVTALALDTGTPYKWLRAGGSAPSWQTITAGNANIIINEVAGGITISGVGGTGSTTPEGHPGTPPFGGNLQYNNGGVFGGLINSGVDVPAGGGMFLGGYFQLKAGDYAAAGWATELDQNFSIAATSFSATRFTMRCLRNDPPLPQYILFERSRGNNAARTTLTNADGIVGVLKFVGWIGAPAVSTQLGFLQVHYETGFGGVVTLAPRDSANVRLTMQDNYAVNGTASATLITAANFFQVQAGGFRISIGTVGAIYYQSHSGSETALTYLNSSTGSNGYVLTLIPGFGTELGSLVPRWQAPAGGPGGGTPAGSLTEIQYRVSGSAFGAIANSAVTTGGLVTLGEQSATLNNAVLTLQSAVAGNGNLTNGHSVGRILFQGQLSGMQDFGVLEGLYNTTPLRTLRLGQGLSGSAYRVIALRDNGEIYLEVSNGSQVSNLKLTATGVTLTPGTGAAANFGTYVRDGSGNIVTVGPGGVGTYLRSSTTSAVPSWQALSFGDFTSGTLPVARGGTNLSSTPSNGAILIGNGTGYSLNQLVGAGGITISYPSAGNITITQTSGSVSAPLTLTLTALTNNPAFTIDHTQSGSGTITDVYGERFYFRHAHSGAVSGAGGRKGVSMIWDHTNSGSGTVSTDGDILLQLFAQNTGSLTLSSYKLTALTIDAYLPANYGTFTGIRIKGINATVRRAIMVDNGGGDVVINSGASLATNAKHGFLYIPAMDNPPNNSGDSITSVVPLGTCALVMCKSNNALYANYGTGWMKVFFGGY